MPIKELSQKRIIDATKALRLGLDGEVIVDRPKPGDPDFYLSHTQLNMMLRCPKQYQFRYVDGRRVPPSGALVFGKAFDVTTSVDYEVRREAGEGLPQEAVLDLFSDSFDRGAGEEDIRWGDEDPGAMKDEGVVLVGNYTSEVSPTVQPKLVQHEGKFRLGAVEMKVVIDLVDQQNTVIDIKTAGRKWSDAAARIQHIPYLWYLSRLTKGARPWEMQFLYHVNVRSAARQRLAGRGHAEMVQILPAVLSKAGFGLYYEQLFTVAKQIKAGLFPPRTAASGNYLCSEKFCGYWSLCAGRGQKVIGR